MSRAERSAHQVHQQWAQTPKDETPPPTRLVVHIQRQPLSWSERITLALVAKLLALTVFAAVLFAWLAPQ